MAGVIEIINGIVAMVGNALCIAMGLERTYQCAGFAAGGIVSVHSKNQ